MKTIIEDINQKREYFIREKSCGAIVTMNGWDENLRKRKYLLVKSGRDGHWGFPKGHIEEGESEQETAIREVFEETGLEIKIVGDFRQRIEYTLKDGAWKENVYFIATYIGTGKAEDNVITQSDEISAHCWLNFEEAIKRLIYAGMKDILTLAHKQKIKKEQ